ncbi:efflux RND transporter periplasmic adaptor subunit [Oleiagrimonas sp. C23AA]|uniref:efflux RND transporter periplasmic adaptor subunit n=1 Tax=Oleiagrimonas sp. C23AA TaxID=2719047 RepID=UPI00141F065D|nr:efflux RND transporter periplasmic adaptor subunit [Oleiagrimonas sp. C23AA]NII11082.1 efflux RND transporter periplasmic adaptor subunit [Oleiagrimonas sp. C23AA]
MPEHPPTRSHRWRLVALALLVLVLAALVVAWLGIGSRRGPAYITQPARVTDITQTISANGTLNPVTLVSVGTQVSGTVQTLHADFNDQVREGQVLLELDPRLLGAAVRQNQASLAVAKAALKLAQSTRDRGQPLFRQGYISHQDYDQLVEAVDAAHAQVALAQAALDQSRTNLRYATIRSPISGVVINRAVDVGQTVAASFQTPTLFQIAKDLTDMQIDSSFAEADIGQIHAGQPVTFTVDAFPDRQYQASVRQVRLNPTTEQNVVTYDVVVGVRNTDGTLMPGMTAYVNVIVAQRHQVLAVPSAALRFHPRAASSPATTPSAPGTSVVYVQTAQGLQARRVTPGVSDGKFVQIKAGDIRAGEPVVVGEVIRGQETSTSGGIRLRAF